jgi:ribosomal protein S18 acetylase RimI-like enzyme
VLSQIQLLPSCQGQGIGERVIAALLDQARREQLPVRLSVLKGNPARRLYERLGFQMVSETGRDATLKWHPPSAI